MADPGESAITGSAAVADSEADGVPERRVSHILWFVALLVLVAALVLALLPNGCSVSEGEWFTEETVPGALAFLDSLERQPVDSLPRDVFTYETIALQTVPNRPQSAEAIYVPYDMDVALATPVRVYSHVEAFASQAQAQGRVTEVLEQYPGSRRTEVLGGGVTPAEVGVTTNLDAWVAAWVRGQFCVYVRVSYDRPVPKDGRAERVLEEQGLYLSNAVDLYQRTGQQGVAARETLEKAGLAPEVPEGIGPPPEDVGAQ